jgi:hypothetical protein
MPDFGSILGLVWWGIIFVCWGVVLIDAFRNGGGLHFLLCLLIPFYALYWAFFRQTIHRGIVVGLIGADLILTVVMALGLVTGKNDPCKLITQADVEEALGQKMEGPEHSSTRGNPVCSYTTVAEPKMSLMIVVIENNQLKSTTDAELPSGAFKVSNLGDDALSDGPALMVQKGTVIFGVTWARPQASRSSLSREQAADAAYFTLEGRKKLARLAIERYKP